MIGLDTASKLLNFGARIGEGKRAQEQLEGAVAVHNILEQHGVAYLADEVGMGKTYVALGALALFRHFQPDFRALIIAPRENIQAKWMKELRTFVASNVRFADLRVKALDSLPARHLVSCENLLELVHEVTLDSNRDFFVRLSSFSLPISGKDTIDPEAVKRFRKSLRHYLPWMRDEVFDLRHKQAFKDNIARALCCALPRFDLVIVDEGHNLKHGFGEHVSARNRVLALALGHPRAEADTKLFPGYGRRAKRVLFLSATPVEETYQHLWNQLDVFGLADSFKGLLEQDRDDAAKKAIAGQFLLRRVTAIRVGDVEHTKNLYRREWRHGGVHLHDEPIRITDPRQRLIVALVQKKVSELLGHEQFNSSFQIGMLASFESFLETTRLKREDADTGNFDDTEQTDDGLERQGIDVGDVNRLAGSYRQRFGSEMPHPKMDGVVESLSDAWRRGRKTLVFVRRVASVKELKRKLDECYDAWLIDRLQGRLPEPVQRRMWDLYKRYRSEKLAAEARSSTSVDMEQGRRADADVDLGGSDTFFAWFFRGEGPRGIISGANVQQRFIQRGAAYATFFEDNVVAEILGCNPGEVEETLAQALTVDRGTLRTGIRERSKRFLSRDQRHARAERFEAVQAAAIEWMKDQLGPYQEGARIAWHERFETSLRIPYASEGPDIGDWLELRTFFTELRHREAIRNRLWPRPNTRNLQQAFRERALRAQLLASAARLGHAFIDLYVMTIRRLGSIELRTQETQDDAKANLEVERIGEYLDLLEGQMQRPLAERDWGAFDELSDIAENFDLVLDVNAADARSKRLTETGRLFGQLLRRQQPVGGMSGQVNQTLVRQFRMPGYPLVLITTDLLQEGEDLHTFCSSVHHYGISWTPSAMEQRIGRIDRVRSQTDRRLSTMPGPLRGEDMLQVYFPHLEDTVEVLQVQRVLERMNVFLRLMHEGLTTMNFEDSTIKASQEFVRTRRDVPQIQERLKSAFKVRQELLHGDGRPLAVGVEVADELSVRFGRLKEYRLPGLDVTWESQRVPGVLLGTAHLGTRVQPFTLLLASFGRWPMVRCISPVGCVEPGEARDAVLDSAANQPMRIGAIIGKDDRSYDLTAQGDVLLADDAETDFARVAMLIKRVVGHADLLEQEHLPGQDEVLETFRDDLREEAIHGC